VVDPDNNKVDALLAVKMPSGQVQEIGVSLGQVRNELN